MKPRFTIFAFVASVCFAFIGYANMYNDWAQKNAVNLSSSANRMECNETSCVQGGLLSTSYSNAGTAAFAAAERFRGKECGIGVESSYIIYEKDGYYYLGTKAWYSNATKARGSAPVEYDQELISQGYNPVAVVHDHPNSKTPWFSTGDAKGAKANELDCYVYTCNDARHGVLALDHNDGKVYEINPHTGMKTGIGKTSPPVNLVRKSGNVGDKDPYQGVLSYQAFPGRNDKVVAAEGLSEIEIDSLCKKNDPLEEKVCHADSVSGNELKATDVVSVNSGNLAGEVGVRGWCKCPNRSANIVTGPLFRMGEDFNVADYSYFFCGDCYKCRKDFNDVADIIKDGTICIWDVKVARANGLDGKTIPDVKAQQQLSEAQDRIMQIPDGKVVIPGLCRCESPRIWLFGESPNRIEMCKDCGRPRSPIPLSAKNPRQPRKLRRCRKTPTSIFVCTCAGDTGVKPNIHASPYDDGDVELSLVCTKCSQVKYSAFVPVREFKKKFANGKPDPQAMLVYMIGTVDIKAAMLAADKEASSQN